jgi:glycosyltransferase involved in cell wall biosynthesis
VQRCGEEIVGGAESLCLQIAEHLNRDLRIEILTTCAADYMTWRNHYTPGNTHVCGVHVHRFPVDRPRDVARFNALSRDMRDRLQTASLAEQEEWMRAQGPLSTALTGYLRAHARRFDTVAFFGYLYATSYFNLPLVAERSVLWPFAHDEWPFALSMWDGFFTQARQIVYSSAEERTLVERRFPNAALQATLVPTGIRMPAGAKAERFREMHDIGGPFVLYLGRIDPSKGCDTLIDYFVKYAADDRAQRKLVLIGDAQMTVPNHPAIVKLGRVDETTKWDALVAADLVVMPSPHESLSLATLEAWAAGKAVLVNAASATLVGQCRRSNGGLWYSAYEEFAGALDILDDNVAATLGAQGRTFVERHYLWDEAASRYRSILSGFDAGAPAPERKAHELPLTL